MKDVFSIDDLASRDLLDAGADKPARLAVIGWPVAHSASPQMQQPALDALGIDARYIRLEVAEGRTAEAFDRMRELGFVGCNITVPHKFAALAYCDEVDPAAKALGAINTIRFDADASRGFNTDGPGFAHAIGEQFGAKLAGLEIAITGAAGGAGQAIATQCVRSGARRLVLINRSQDKLAALMDHLTAFHAATEIIALGFEAADLADQCRASQLIVNTSSVGLKADDPPILPAACLRPGHWVYDTIYQPAQTPLLKLAETTGCQTANGLSMLIHQGALSFQHWFPGAEPLPWMRRALGR